MILVSPTGGVRILRSRTADESGWNCSDGAAVLDDDANDPQQWTAKFIRGMNHLHWPRKLGHAPQAIRDFSELIALQQKLPAGSFR